MLQAGAGGGEHRRVREGGRHCERPAGLAHGGDGHPVQAHGVGTQHLEEEVRIGQLHWTIVFYDTSKLGLGSCSLIFFEF